MARVRRTSCQQFRATRLYALLRRGARADVGRRVFFFPSRRRPTRSLCDWSSDVCLFRSVLRGSLTLGALTVLASYLARLLNPIERLNDIAETASKGFAGGERLIGLLDQRPAVEDARSEERRVGKECRRV